MTGRRQTEQKNGIQFGIKCQYGEPFMRIAANAFVCSILRIIIHLVAKTGHNCYDYRTLID